MDISINFKVIEHVRTGRRALSSKSLFETYSKFQEYASLCLIISGSGYAMLWVPTSLPAPLPYTEER